MADASHAEHPNSPGGTAAIDSVRNQVAQLIADPAENLSQADVSREASVNTSTLSRFLKSAYPGDNAEIAMKLAKWLDTRRTRAASQGQLPTAPAFVDTTISRRVLAALGYAQMAGDIAVVYGGAGLGKTKATRRYAEQHSSVWLVEMTRSHGRLLGALERIAATLGLRGIAREPAKVQDKIHDRVEGTGGLLVIDEAQHLDNDALEAIRAIHDATGIGVVLIGNEVLYSRLTGGKRDAGFAQLFSRIGKRVRLTRASAADADAIADAWNVEDAEARELLRDIVAKPGALRGATKCLRLASVSSAAGARGITAQHLVHAWQELGGAE